MIYKAKLLSIDDDIEEKVVLQIKDTTITCFANLCPYPIKVNSTYNIAITPIVLNEYYVQEDFGKSEASLEQIGNSFSYRIYGILNGPKILSGCLEIEDVVLERDYSFLDGKNVIFIVDRIDVEFC